MYQSAVQPELEVWSQPLQQVPATTGSKDGQQQHKVRHWL